MHTLAVSMIIDARLNFPAIRDSRFQACQGGAAILGALPRNPFRELRELFREQEWEYAPSQRSPVPGSPGYPEHPLWRKIAYVAISLLVGLTGGFGNALISVNLPYLEGALGLDTYEIVWLPTVYAIMNCLGGGLLFKYRQEFGARSFAVTFLTLQLAIIVAHLFVQDLGSAILVRAVSGLSATAMTTLCIYYMTQAFPPSHRPSGIVLGISIPQLAIPLARVIPLDTITLDKWQGLYLIELGLSALSLACVLAFRLPPSVKQKAFEKRDFLTMAFYGAAVACFGSAVGLGPYLWWWDQAWIGWCLAASLPLFVIAFIIESGRKAPLIDLKWLSGFDLVRFAIVAILIRIVLAEQPSGAVGLLRLFGLVNDDFRDLSIIILASSVAGPIVAAILITADRIPAMIITALLLVMVGSYLDSYSSDLTRAPQFYFTQALIAFATTFFIGPALLFGLTRVLAKGGQILSSFVILFSITQSVGSLVGSALIQSAQFVSERYHSTRLVSYVTGMNPAVDSYIAKLSAVYSSVLTDPAELTAVSIQTLGQQTTLQANILAYNDTFRLVSAIAMLTACFLGCVFIIKIIKSRDGVKPT